MTFDETFRVMMWGERANPVHVLPADGKHIVSPECHCKPVPDAPTETLRAQGYKDAASVDSQPTELRSLA